MKVETVGETVMLSLIHRQGWLWYCHYQRDFQKNRTFVGWEVVDDAGDDARTVHMHEDLKI